MIIALGALAGLSLLFYRVLEFHRFKKKTSELIETNKFQCLNYAKTSAIVLSLATILPLGCLIYSFYVKEEALIAASLACTIVSFAEVMNVFLMFKFYYNESSCLIKDKVIRYKSIKRIVRKPGIPFGRYVIYTFNNEQYDLSKEPATIVKSKTNLAAIGDRVQKTSN